MARTPKKIVNAFFPPVVKFKANDGSDIVLGEFTAAKLMFLQRLEHPLVSSDPAEGGKIVMNTEATIQLLFVLCRPIEECKAVLDDGDDAFDTAVLKFADLLPVKMLGAIRSAVLDNFARAWSTALATVPPGQKKTP